jgi:hypothetical protein
VIARVSNEEDGIGTNVDGPWITQITQSTSTIPISPCHTNAFSRVKLPPKHTVVVAICDYQRIAVKRDAARIV